MFLCVPTSYVMVELLIFTRVAICSIFSELPLEFHVIVINRLDSRQRWNTSKGHLCPLWADCTTGTAKDSCEDIHPPSSPKSSVSLSQCCTNPLHTNPSLLLQTPELWSLCWTWTTVPLDYWICPPTIVLFCLTIPTLKCWNYFRTLVTLVAVLPRATAPGNVFLVPTFFGATTSKASHLIWIRASM